MHFSVRDTKQLYEVHGWLDKVYKMWRTTKEISMQQSV